MPTQTLFGGSIPGPVRASRPPGQLTEIGVSGLNRQGKTGYIFEEFLPQLEGSRGRRVFREMSANDPIVAAVLYAIDKLIRNVKWRVEGPDEKTNQFVDSCLIDMSHTFEDLMSEILSMLVYGWSYFEICYKLRRGPSNDPLRNSRYTDGKIGWRKIPIRSQDSLANWEFGGDGGILGMIQSAPPDYQRVLIPIDTSLLFRTTSHKNNPEGLSILRAAYRPWYGKKRIEDFEGIGIERDLAGLPVIYASPEIQAQYGNDLRQIVRNVKRDEQEGLLLPLIYDENGNKMLTFELQSTGGTRQFDTSKIITRKNQEIAMSCLADFIMLGQDKAGSYALSTNKTDLFALSLGTYLQGIAAVFNRHAIPRLLAINAFPVAPDAVPQLKPGDIQSANLAELGDFISKISGAGCPLFPDGELENKLRSAADLPPRPEGGIQPQPAPTKEPPK